MGLSTSTVFSKSKEVEGFQQRTNRDAAARLIAPDQIRARVAQSRKQFIQNTSQGIVANRQSKFLRAPLARLETSGCLLKVSGRVAVVRPGHTCVQFQIRP